MARHKQGMAWDDCQTDPPSGWFIGDLVHLGEHAFIIEGVTFAPKDRGLAESVTHLRLRRVICEACDGTGNVYEPCGCNECEYEDKHGKDIPCPDCQPLPVLGKGP